MNISKEKCMDYGMFLLRFVVGMGFLLHGLQKLGNMSPVVGFFSMVGLPVFVAWIVAIVETIAGVLMIVGLWTRYAGYAIALVMLGAIILMHFKQGFLGGMELPLLYLASALTIAWSSSYKWSLGKNCCGGMHSHDTCSGSSLPEKSCDGCDGYKNICSMHEGK